MASQPKHYFSVQEYLDQEEQSLERHEYLNGEIFAMANATPEHALIAPNIFAAIRPQLNKTGCRIRNADMRIRTSPTGLYSYADAVISRQAELFDGTTLLNPVVIIEVLSDSTEHYDRGGKFERYREIPSFREYLVVAQDRVYVEHHVRAESLLDHARIHRTGRHRFSRRSPCLLTVGDRLRRPEPAHYFKPCPSTTVTTRFTATFSALSTCPLGQ